MQQVGLGDVAAHAVAQQEDRQPRLLLADVLVEAGQVADHFVPAILFGIQAQRTFVGGAAVATLVQRIQAVAGGAQGCGQARITTAVLGHAMGQHHQGLGRAFGHPLIDVQAAAVIRGQPEGAVVHGDSFAQGRCSV